VREGKGKVEEKASQGYWLLKDTQLVFIYFCYFDELHSFCTRRRIDFISHTFLAQQIRTPYTQKHTCNYFCATKLSFSLLSFLFLVFCNSASDVTAFSLRFTYMMFNNSCHFNTTPFLFFDEMIRWWERKKGEGEAFY